MYHILSEVEKWAQLIPVSRSLIQKSNQTHFMQHTRVLVVHMSECLEIICVVVVLDVVSEITLCCRLGSLGRL